MHVRRGGRRSRSNSSWLSARVRTRRDLMCLNPSPLRVGRPPNSFPPGGQGARGRRRRSRVRRRDRAQTRPRPQVPWPTRQTRVSVTQTTAVGVVMTGAGRPQAGGSAALATDRVRPTSMEGQAVLCSQHGARDQRLAAGRKGPESRSRCTRDGWSGGLGRAVSTVLRRRRRCRRRTPDSRRSAFW